MQIHEKLKDLREDHDLTLAEVAEQLNTSYQYYQKYEKGKHDIPTKHIITLCKLYGVSADYLLGLPKGMKWPR